MDTRDGRIYTAEAVERMPLSDRQHMRPMTLEPTPLQNATGKVGRNDPCPCGSGAKFKRCCLMIKPATLNPEPPSDSAGVEAGRERRLDAAKRLEPRWEDCLRRGDR